MERLNIKSFQNGIRAKKFSAREITDEYIKKIEEDSEVKPYISVLKEYAQLEADKVDALINDKKELPSLAGVPFGIKDNILIENFVTTAGSQMLASYKASYSATVIEKLKSEHAVFLGKTNMDEFAMGSSTENSSFHITKNPHDTERVPGGSSGGSAAAVAGGFAMATLGSDTGGSIREPAAFCGVVGFKPTYGAVSRFGVVAMASSLDQIGPITESVEDASAVFDAIKGHDKFDATSSKEVFGRTEFNKEMAEKMTIGIPKEYFEGGLESEVGEAVQNAIAVFKDAGMKIKEVSLPHSKYALACYYIIMPAEVSANLARFDGIRYGRDKKAKTLWEIYKNTRGEGFGKEVKRRILLGTFVLSSGYYDAYYAKAQKVRQLITNEFNDVFDKSLGGVDAILAPTTPSRAFKVGEKTNDPIEMYLSDIFTVPVNLAGLPALSLPVKKYTVGSGELPIGFQLIGNKFEDRNILNLGMWYEKETGSQNV